MIILRQNEFSKKKKEDSDKKDKKRTNHKTSLSEYGSARGYGRSVAISGLKSGVRGGQSGAAVGGLGGAALGSGIDVLKDIATDGKISDKTIKNAGKKSVKGAVILGSAGALGGDVISGLAPGVISVASGKRAADRADRQGKDDKDIVKSARKAGAKSGAISGAVKRAIISVPSAIRSRSLEGVGKSLGEVSVSSALGALGGMSGASKNTKSRLKKRNKYEEEIED